MVGADLGPWQPLDVATTVAVFEGLPFRWWLSGGRALELHLGRSWRDHDDTDVGVLRRELDAVASGLARWELHVAAAGRLRPWEGQPLAADRHENNVWCRRDGGPWELDLTVNEGDASTWVHRRNATVRVPMGEAVLRTADGIPYLAPELQLLCKSVHLRPKDDVDAAEVVPALDEQRRGRLVRLLPREHPWQRLLV